MASAAALFIDSLIVENASLILDRINRSKRSRGKWQHRLNAKLEGESVQKNIDVVLHAYEEAVKGLMMTFNSQRVECLPSNEIKPIRDLHLKHMRKIYQESNCITPPLSTLNRKLEFVERDVSSLFYNGRRGLSDIRMGT